MVKAAFGAGCFWGVEAAFQKIKGVKSTVVGYMGGVLKNPKYEDVCTDKTGHAEVVKLDYDPELITYEELLEIFWKIHDPTQLNRQGPDFGSQYRSVIFYYGVEQRKIAEESKNKKQAEQKDDIIIVTEITPAGVFYPAEEYHQKYFDKRGSASCEI
jgi:peptide-methionine (S)-S-oxide reductase